MMFKNREELLNRIWENYREFEDNAERSFIFKYIKDRKTAKAIALAADRELLLECRAKPRFDRFTLLHAAHLASKNKLITKQEFSEIFNEIAEKEKVGRKNMPKASKAALEWLENRLLKSAVGDFFSNNGFKKGVDDAFENSLSGGSDRNLKKVRNKSEGNIDDLEMAFLFAKAFPDPDALPLNEAPSEGGITDEYIEKCRNLFLLARSSETDEMLVPLYFDARSGAGIFIVGNEILGNSNGESCAPFIFCFWVTDESEEPLNPDDSPTIPMIMDTKESKSIDEAFVIFSNERGGELYCENYASYNTDIPSGEADAVFRRLLISREDIIANRDTKIMERENREENEGLAKSGKDHKA